jgi:hypothetical protein
MIIYTTSIVFFLHALPFSGLLSQKNCQPKNSPVVLVDLNTPEYDPNRNPYTVIKQGKQYWLKENLRTTFYTITTRIATALTHDEGAKTNGAKMKKLIPIQT